jgi:putative membrane protein insertion efficiency factor
MNFMKLSGRILGRLLSLPLLALIFVYRKLVSPVLPPACRYYPSCSHYAEEAVRLHGPFRGLLLALRRLLRCHPWAAGGPDPVPLP